MNPRIAWLASFPNSGTSFTMTMVARATNTTFATNYGIEANYGSRATPSLPIYPRHPEGPYMPDPETSFHHRSLPYGKHVITKTHCGGYCVNCGPDEYSYGYRKDDGGDEQEQKHEPRDATDDNDQDKDYTEYDEYDDHHHLAALEFLQDCASGHAIDDRGNLVDVSYPPERVSRVIHLIRNPFHNVIARFHLERKHHGDANTTEDRTWLESHPDNHEGLDLFCKEQNQERWDQETKFFESDFFQWQGEQTEIEENKNLELSYARRNGDHVSPTETAFGTRAGTGTNLKFSTANGNGNGNGNDSAPLDENHPDLTKSKLLTPERMEALKTINFEFQLWTVEPSQWEQRFQELLAYRTEHGHFHVTNKQNATLSSWCKTQRQRYKNTMAIYQGLYGVELTCPQKKARELYEKAKEKVKEAREAAGDGDGNAVKAAAMSTPNLTDIGEAKNMMDPERICKLNAVGFEWELQKDTYVESWENRYNQLLKFKVINGHCRVPKSSGDNPQLGQWVKQMRKYHGWKEDGKPYPSTFTEERIARLNELGFEWRLKDTPMKSATPKPEDEANTPVIAARILNSQLGNAVDVTPLPQYQQQGAAAAAAAAASLPINTGNGTSVSGAAGENGQNMNWGWGNNGFDGTGNSATV
mmetsp:Transcript_5939/g.14751  ORF Transcript_5939/g.14751 Transcript_5939/m.14751 type:complete len:643 (+) Transcript_5939:420-2348(+)